MDYNTIVQIITTAFAEEKTSHAYDVMLAVPLISICVVLLATVISANDKKGMINLQYFLFPLSNIVYFAFVGSIVNFICVLEPNMLKILIVGVIASFLIKKMDIFNNRQS